VSEQASRAAASDASEESDADSSHEDSDSDDAPFSFRPRSYPRMTDDFDTFYQGLFCADEIRKTQFTLVRVKQFDL
jgi:hypothetical protein